MRSCHVVAILILTMVTSFSSAQSPAKTEPSSGTHVQDCSSGEPCGLPGVPSSELLCSLGSAISDLGHNKIGFPLDILAAAYGLNDEGKRYSLGRWHLKVSKMEDAFSRAKVLMADPQDAPALVPLDIPGLGPHVYDADLIRALVSTDLFEYPMHVIVRHREGVKVAYVLLNAAIGTSLRHHLSKQLQPYCTLAGGSPKQELQSTKGGFAFLSGAATSLAEPEGDAPSKTADQEPPQKILDLLKLADAQEFIRVQTQPCELWSGLALEAHPKAHYPEPTTGCEFGFDLIIPRRTAAAYSKLELSAEIKSPANHFVLCGPKLRLPDGEDFEPKKETINCPDCSVSPFTWELSGEILQAGQTQPFHISVQASGEAAKTAFIIQFTLDGTSKPWWQDWWERVNGSPQNKHSATWCVGCKRD